MNKSQQYRSLTVVFFLSLFVLSSQAIAVEDNDENKLICEYCEFGFELIGDFTWSEIDDGSTEDDQRWLGHFFHYKDNITLDDKRRWAGTSELDLYVSDGNRTTGTNQNPSPEIYWGFGAYTNLIEPEDRFNLTDPVGLYLGLKPVLSYTDITSGNISGIVQGAWGSFWGDNSKVYTLATVGYDFHTERDFSKGDALSGELELRFGDLENFKSYTAFKLKAEELFVDENSLNDQATYSIQLSHNFKFEPKDNGIKWNNHLRFNLNAAVGYDDVDNYLGTDSSFESAYVLITAGFEFSYEDLKGGNDGTGRWVNGRFYRP